MNSLYPNFYQVCRLCLSKLNGSYIPLFEDSKINSENVNYRVKIKFCFSITVEETDNLPNALCNTCMKDVDKFYTFKETVVRNNSFLKAYTCGHIHKNGERPCKEKTSRHTQVNISKAKEKDTSFIGGNELSNADNDPIDKFLQSTKDKIKIEMIPQVHDSSFDSSQTIATNFDSNVSDSSINNNSDDNDVSKEEIKNTVPYFSPTNTQLNLSNRTFKVEASGIYSKVDNNLLSPIHNHNTISGSREYSINSSLPENSIGGDADSEDTKSASSDTFRYETEDDPRLIIDEECDIKSEFNGELEVIESKPDNCISLQALTNSTTSDQYSNNDSITNISSKLSISSSSSISIKNELIKRESSPNRSNSPRRYSSLQGSTRRKQKCPTKSIDGLGDGEENIEERSQSPNIHHQIINISPITVTCSSVNNDREEVVGYSQAQFLDEVLSRHSSPATTPPIIPLHAERLHKACDVLLRAASKIQDLPIVMEEFSISNSSDCKQEERENNKPPLSTRNTKTKNVIQNAATPQKECSNCHAIQTTIWRRDRFGKIVCNACGLYYKLHNFDRPCRMRRDEIHKRNRKRNPGEKGKRNKRNGNMSFVNELSSKSYSDSCYDSIISSEQVYSLANGVSKKRRKSSSTVGGGGGGNGRKSLTTASVGKDDVCLIFTQSADDGAVQQDVLLSPEDELTNAHTVINERVNKKPLIDLFNNHDKLKSMTAAALQISTHFTPIEVSDVTSTDRRSNSPVDENIVNDDAPLNLAAGGH